MDAGNAEDQASGLHQETDADLLAAARGRNAQAFSRIVSRHYTSVYRVVFRMLNGHPDSEDVAQEAFLRLWNNPDQVREAAALKGWLMRVASNLVMDRFRAHPMQDLETAAEISDGKPSAEDTLSSTWASRRIDQAVAGLPERQKLALTLVHFEHMGNIAAAAAMDISVEALESLLARARRSLKNTLVDDRKLLLDTLQGQGH